MVGPAKMGTNMCSMSSVPPTASILHADLDAFYASVEQRDRAELRGRPVIVGSGVVLAASYEARAHGVHTAMPGRRAARLCPDAVVVEPRMAAYSQASRDVFDVFRDTTPVVEGLSIDEAFLDVSGLARLAGEPVAIASELRRRVRDEVGLVLTVGVARTKFLAKVASGVAKPDGLLVVPPDREREFLHPLPVRRLWGVGPVTERRLAERGITNVAEVARLGPDALVSLLGPAAGRHLDALAHNRDPRPVVTGRRRASVGAQRALGRGHRTRPTLEAALGGLVDRVSSRLRSGGRVGRTVVLRLRFDDFARITRSRTLHEATSATHEIGEAAHGLLDMAYPLVQERGLTLIGVTVANLGPADAVQQALPFARRDRTLLDLAVDGIHERFGNHAIGRTALLGHRQIEVPLLPE